MSHLRGKMQEAPTGRRPATVYLPNFLHTWKTAVQPAANLLVWSRIWTRSRVIYRNYIKTWTFGIISQRNHDTAAEPLTAVLRRTHVDPPSPSIHYFFPQKWRISRLVHDLCSLLNLTRPQIHNGSSLAATGTSCDGG